MLGDKLSRLGMAVAISLSMLSPALAQGSRGAAFTPINIEEIRTAAKSELSNARAAGRLTAEESEKLEKSLTDANSLEQIESTWAQVEARAQEVKSNHLSIDHLLKTFSQDIDGLLKKKTITNEDAKFYRDRIEGIKRLQKQFTAGGKRLDFWQFTVLALDLSSVQERLVRSLTRTNPEYESIDDLILRSDMYTARNAVCARGLNTYKSYILEPNMLINSKNVIFGVLQDRANSKIETPEVAKNLRKRLVATHYEAGPIEPTEDELKYACQEVQRLIDSGIKNGNIGQADATRLQQELELVKQIDKAYPGPLPGIDPFEKELRHEEVRFMASDIRFMQDWLARLLRKDGDTNASREQLLTVLRRTNLAYFTHRISRSDVNSILALMYTAFKSTDGKEQVKLAQLGQGKLDMMIADYSWKPVDVATRMQELDKMIAKLKHSKSDANEEKNRIEAMLRSLPQNTSPEKVGATIVAGSELELLRNRVASVLKEEQKTALEVNQ